MPYALVLGTRICQVVETAEERFEVAPDLQWVSVPDGTSTADTYVDGQVVPFVPPTLLPPISDRQFFQQLATMGVITPEEALAAVKTGDIPAPLEALIANLPTDQQFAARMLLSGATVFERTHPMTDLLAAGMGWSPEEVDALWRAAAKL